MSRILRSILAAAFAVAVTLVSDAASARGGFGGAHMGMGHIGGIHGGYPGLHPGFPGAIRPGYPIGMHGFYGYRRFGSRFGGPLVIGGYGYPYGYYGYDGPSCVLTRLLVPTPFGLRYGLVPICF